MMALTIDAKHFASLSQEVLKILNVQQLQADWEGASKHNLKSSRILALLK